MSETDLWLTAFREAVASTAMSHAEACDCRVCRAHRGDHEAMWALAVEAASRPPGEDD